MNISYNIIVDYMRPFLARGFKPAEQNREFDCIQLLPEEISELEPEHLYFGRLSQLISSPMADMPGLYLVCVEDEVCEKAKDIRCQMILVRSDHSETKLFNTVQSLFIRMNKWERDMYRAIADKVPVQNLLNLCGDNFRKPLFVFDYALNTIASINDTHGTDLIVNTISSHGGLPDEYIRFIIDNNILTAAKSYKKLGLLRNNLKRPFNVLIKSLRANTLSIDCVVMFFDRELPTPSDYDYMRYFVNMLDRFIQLNGKGNGRQIKNDQSFFIDCIEGRIVSKADMQRRAMLVGIPCQGRFSLSCVRFDSFSYSSAIYLMDEMAAANPTAVIFVYKQEVILINNESRFPNSEADKETIAMRSDDYLKKHNAKVGISGICTDLFALRISYIQAAAAIELGSLLDPGGFCYRYRDYFFYHIISSASKSIDFRYLYAQRLNSVIEYDREHGSDNVRLLEVYLMNEFSVSKTAEIMHLHRNSVIYRLDKIKTLMGESLEDPVFRANLLLSCFTLRLKNAMENEGEDV